MDGYRPDCAARQNHDWLECSRGMTCRREGTGPTTPGLAAQSVVTKGYNNPQLM